MALSESALVMLEATSRTFFIPISRLPSGLQEAVGSAYLCMRAIDEIEDHARLDHTVKIELLHAVSLYLQAGNIAGIPLLFEDHLDVLPEVTVQLGEWALEPSKEIAHRIWDATAALADRMAIWASTNWKISSEADLDAYTFGVAGAVGLLLSDLWSWYDGLRTDRNKAVGFGRGLQAVNILRNKDQDEARGVNLFPIGWGVKEMRQYALRNLALGDAYTIALPPGPPFEFSNFILVLANATLDAMERGEQKLSRAFVLQLAAETRRRTL